MHVPAARRFGNVEEVNILGFIKGPEQFGEPCHLSADVTSRSASFLSAFPKLSRAFIGGEVLYASGEKHTMQYFQEDDYNDDHEEIIRSLAQSICGAFKTASPNIIQIFVMILHNGHLQINKVGPRLNNARQANTSIV